MATTVLRNGIDRFKWQRPFTKGKFASCRRWHDDEMFGPRLRTNVHPTSGRRRPGSRRGCLSSVISIGS